jgi:hypothetical protein
MSTEKFDAWGIVELMGHQRVAGRISERAIGGGNLLQVDIPQADDSFRTVFYGSSAIYALHVTDEAAARAVAKVGGSKPTYALELERVPRLSAPNETTHTDQDDEEFPL